MRRIIVILVTAFVFTLSYTGSSAAISGSHTHQNDRKEARKYKKEARKASRHSGTYRARETRMKYDQDRVMRKNYKERKKMYRSSKRENRRGWDTNQTGNVLGGN